MIYQKCPFCNKQVEFSSAVIDFEMFEHYCEVVKENCTATMLKFEETIRYNFVFHNKKEQFTGGVEIAFTKNGKVNEIIYFNYEADEGSVDDIEIKNIDISKTIYELKLHTKGGEKRFMKFLQEFMLFL